MTGTDTIAPELRSVIHALIGQIVIRRDHDEDLYRTAVRNLDTITEWFTRRLGWKVTHVVAAEAVRVAKRSANPPADRGPHIPRDSRRLATRHDLAVAMLACGHLWRRPRMTFRDLQRLIATQCAADDTLPDFSFVATEDVSRADAQQSRRTLVDALLLLGALGIVTTSAAVDATTAEDDAELVVEADQAMLATLLACPPPTLLGLRDLPASRHVDVLCRDTVDDSTTPDELTPRRHAAARAVVDDPVVLPDDHDPYLLSAGGANAALQVCADANLTVTRRRDVWQITDPTGQATDNPFPRGRSMVRQASLALLAHLIDTDGPLARADVETLYASYRTTHPKWAAGHTDAELTSRAAADLTAMGLLHPLSTDDTHLRPTPAIHLWTIDVTLGATS